MNKLYCVFELPKSVKTKDEARQLAILWQGWFSQTSLTYGELCQHQNYFLKLAKKFNLTSEFSENGII